MGYISESSGDPGYSAPHAKMQRLGPIRPTASERPEPPLQNTKLDPTAASVTRKIPKPLTPIMKLHFLLSTIVVLAISSFAQVPYNSAVPNGPTRKAAVSEQVGLTQVTITYNRPQVKGREGKIWGQLVPKGFVDQGFGNGKPTPWRAGANENTIIEFDNDVKVEGQPLAKGR